MEAGKFGKIRPTNKWMQNWLLPSISLSLSLSYTPIYNTYISRCMYKRRASTRPLLMQTALPINKIQSWWIFHSLNIWANYGPNEAGSNEPTWWGPPMSLSQCHSTQSPPSLQLLNIRLPPCSPPHPSPYTFTSPCLAHPFFFFPLSSLLHPLPPQRFALVMAAIEFC